MLNDRIALFCECFGDNESTAGNFFACSDILNVSLFEDHRLVSMASLVPILEVDSDTLGYYIYGVCVAPDMRGKGLFKRIMSLAEAEARCHGAKFVCLVPGDDRLADTYKRMGYLSYVHQKELSNSKGLRLLSDEFRKFAHTDDNTAVRQKGLLKIIDSEASFMFDEKLCFLDDMGDV